MIYLTLNKIQRIPDQFTFDENQYESHYGASNEYESNKTDNND